MRGITVGTCLTILAASTAAAIRAAEPPPVVSRLAAADEVRKKLGLAPAYQSVAGIDNIKIAVLDYGFDGIDGQRAYLPRNAVVVEHYDPAFVRRFGLGDPGFQKGFAPDNHHGRTMAQIVWAVTGSSPRGPQFYLLNANGPTMLRRAVRYAIEARVDIILFSAVFEGGGNGDGRGPINQIIAEALAADIIWINAAGNFGGRVFQGPFDKGPGGYLRLATGSDPTALRFRNRLDENTVTVTLTWDDYQDEEDAGTDRDLDLYVEDSLGNRLGASELRQVSGPHPAGDGETRNPRERLVLTDLPASDNDYRIRIQWKRGNFTIANQVRVLLTATRDGKFQDPRTKTLTDAIQFPDASPGGEIYPPADNPGVITVSDASAASSVGPTLDRRVKPDIVIEDSQAFFTNGDSSVGASNAAAYFTGVVAVLKAAEPGLRTRHLLWLARRLVPSTASPGDTPPTSPGREITLAEARIEHPEIVDAVRQAAGARPVRAFASPYDRLILGVEQSPAALRGLFPRFPDNLRDRADAYEYFLLAQLVATVRGPEVRLTDYYRRKPLPDGRRDPFPWEAQDLQPGRPGRQDFVEVRQVLAPGVIPASGRGVLQRRLWRTPGRPELASIVRTQ